LAFKWFKRGAEQGNAESQYILALMHGSPQNLPDKKINLSIGGSLIQVHNFPVRQDYVRAFVWASLSANQAHVEARKLRDLLARELPKNDLNRAKFLLKECINRSLVSC